MITREPGPLPGINTKITACLDPDGWKSVCLFLGISSALSVLFLKFYPVDVADQTERAKFDSKSDILILARLFLTCIE